jgi:hypothetical protein
MGAKRRLVDVSCEHAHLMVARAQVELSEVAGAPRYPIRGRLWVPTTADPALHSGVGQDRGGRCAPPQPRRDVGGGAPAASTGTTALQEVLRRKPSRHGARRRRLGMAAPPPPDCAVARPAGSTQAGSPICWHVRGVGTRRQGRLPPTTSRRRQDP